MLISPFVSVPVTVGASVSRRRAAASPIVLGLCAAAAQLASHGSMRFFCFWPTAREEQHSPAGMQRNVYSYSAFFRDFLLCLSFVGISYSESNPAPVKPVEVILCFCFCFPFSTEGRRPVRRAAAYLYLYRTDRGHTTSDKVVKKVNIGP